MNIAIFASAFSPSLGGVEELCRQLALELMRQGHGVIVLTNRWPRDLPATASIDGISVYRLPFRNAGHSPKATLTHYLTRPFTERRMLHILKRERIDVLHIQCITSNAPYAMVAQRRLRIPLVATLQGELTMDANRIFEKFDLARRILRQTLENADAVTACSRRTMLDTEAFLGRQMGAKGRVIFNGVDVAEFSGAARHQHARPYIFALGRFVREKGFDILLRAFATGLYATHDLLIAGDGAEKQALTELAVKLGVHGNVHFPGRADRRQVASYMAGCEYFVISSPAEPFGIVILEAMAAGAPVIAVNNAGPAEIITDGVNGLLVERSEPALLAAAMQRLMGDIALRDRLSTAGREHAAEFSWAVIAQQYLAAYAAAAAAAAAENAGVRS